MIYTAHHVLAVLLIVAAGVVLLRSPWTHHAPRAAVITWQALQLGCALALVGALLSAGLAPYGLGVFPGLAQLLLGDGPGLLAWWQLALVAAGIGLGGWFVGGQIVDAVRIARARSRHRQLLDLVAGDDLRAEEALVIDHPAAAAYCLPGRRSCVVLSAGTLDLLDGQELKAVLAHERAHAAERHDLVLLPFAAVRRWLPGGGATRVLRTVELLIEMCADDRAAHQYGHRAVANALARFRDFGAALPPPGTLGAVGAGINERIARLAPGKPLHRARGRLAVLCGLTLATTPLSLFLLPL